MRASKECIEAIKQFEGLRLNTYKCPAGVLTIGYGHTKGVRQNMRITEARAEEFLKEDLRAIEDDITALGLTLTQSQFDALVDFVFNLGIARLKSSTLLKKIRAGAPAEEIQTEFKRWIYSGKRVMQGLVKRRIWEATRWVS